MRRTDWLILTSLAISTALFVVNLMLARSSYIGIAASALYFSSASVVLSRLLYPCENTTYKMVLSILTSFMILALVGGVFIIFGHFDEMSSLIILAAIAASLGFALVVTGKKMSTETSTSTAQTSPKKVSKKPDIESIVFVIPYILSVAAAFRLLWLSRTGEGGASVWLEIPSLFDIVFIIGAFSGVMTIFFTNLRQSIKLALICLFSFLSHSLFVLVWYPGRYGDPWSHLGEIRFILRTGMPYAYSWVLRNSLWLDLLSYRGAHSLVAFFTRMFYVDAYWINAWIVPILWSVFAPLLAYKISESIAIKRTRMFPLLAAFVTVVFPSLIAWGAVSVPNSLGFIFFFVLSALLAIWLINGGRQIWVLALLAAAAASLAHPQAGIFAFMLMLLATVIRKTSRKELWIASFLLMSVVYPLALHLDNASFALDGLFQIANFLAFQSQVATFLLALGFLGLVAGIRNKYVNSKAAMFFFAFYAIVLGEFYFTNYGMVNLPYGSSRILVIADFLLVPFVALGFLSLIALLRKTISRAKNTIADVPSMRFGLRINPRIFGLLLIGLFLSLQATAALYVAYPQKEIVQVQPSVYELDAIRFIDSNSPQRYVVICEPGFASLAIGAFGMDYGYLGGTRGVFGYPDWSYPTIQMYSEMTKAPSLGIMQQAIEFASAKYAYFVVSERNPNLDQVVNRTSEILPIYRVFGDGKLYIFMYPLPLIEESGPAVTVVFDDGLNGQQDIQTKLVYMVESEINSTVTLMGFTSYNITAFPSHWTFLDLRVNNKPSRFDDSSDVNSFVYVKGLQQSDVLTISWLFNRRFTEVGWKEDSFKRLDLWHAHELYGGTIVPRIYSDGNVLRMSHFFRSGFYQYYYYVSSVGLSTDDYPYLLMRWRCDKPVAIAAVYFESGRVQEAVPMGGMSEKWSAIVVPLQSGEIVDTVMVGITNVENLGLDAQATLEIDYIMLSGEPKP